MKSTTFQTLRTPLGLTFAVFAFTIGVCVFSCYRAIGYAWGKSNGRHFSARSIGIESGALRLVSYQDDPQAEEFVADCGMCPRWATPEYAAGRADHHAWARIPEPLGVHRDLSWALFVPRKERWVSPAVGELKIDVIIPLWPLALLTIFPACKYAGQKYRQRITRRRLRKGCCIKCGYDLRFSPVRCPECGTEISVRQEIEPLRHAA